MKLTDFGSTFSVGLHLFSEFITFIVITLCFYCEHKVLISVTAKGSSLDFFNPTQLLSAECMASLVDILNDPSVKTRPTLAQKSMILLLNLGLYFTQFC